MMDSESMIKGRVAEAIIEQLFLASGYKVFRFGMENVVPGVMKDLKGVRSDTSKNIRRMPDFLIQDKEGEVFFIEVKFRKDGKFKYENLKDDNYPYEDCFFVVVSKKFIQCVTFKELKNGKNITDKTKYYLTKVQDFDLNKDTITKFCGFVHTFFGNT